MSTWVPGSDANFGTSPLLATPVVPGTPHRFAFHRHFAIALFFTDPCVHVTGSPKPRAGTRFKVCPGHINHAHSSGDVRKKIGPLLRVQKNYAKNHRHRQQNRDLNPPPLHKHFRVLTAAPPASRHTSSNRCWLFLHDERWPRTVFCVKMCRFDQLGAC